MGKRSRLGLNLVFNSLFVLFANAAFAAPTQARVVSLAPNLTEMLFAMGAGPQVIAVDEDSDYPPAAQALPRVSRFSHINTEALLMLQPDAVVAMRNTEDTVQLHRLSALQVPVNEFSITRVNQVADIMVKLGRLTGQEEAANKLAMQFRAQYKHLKKIYRHNPKRRVFFELWAKPLMSVNNKSLIGQLLKACGAKNIYAHAPIQAPTVTQESVIAHNPEIIFVTNPAEKAKWQAWPELAAVKQNAIIVVNPNWLERPGPRLLQGMAQVCEAVAKQSPA